MSRRKRIDTASIVKIVMLPITIVLGGLSKDKEKLRKRAQLAASIALGVLAIILLEAVDPFNLSSAAAKQSLNFIQPLLASSYDKGSRYTTDARSAQKQIVVVLYTDAVAQKNRVSYRNQLKTLRAITKSKPKAIFMDLVYWESHESKAGHKYFVDQLLKAQEENDVPIYISGIPEQEGRLDCSRETSIQSTEQPALYINEVFPRLPVSWDAEDYEYPSSARLNEGCEYIATPAYQLFEAYKLTGTDKNLAVKKYEEEGETLIVRWGRFIKQEDKGLFFLDDSNCQNTKATKVDLLDPARYFFGAILNEFNKRDSNDIIYRATCPYSKTIFAEILHDQNFLESEKEEVTSLFDNKIVLIGANLTGSQNKVISPVHGKLPSVYFHAMALDNLIAGDVDKDKNERENIWRKNNPLWGWLTKSLATQMFLYILFSISAHLIEEKLQAKGARLFYAYIVVILLIAFTVIGSLHISVKIGITPDYWLGVSLLAVLLLSPLFKPLERKLAEVIVKTLTIIRRSYENKFG